jgi:hypothetical protein
LVVVDIGTPAADEQVFIRLKRCPQAGRGRYHVLPVFRLMRGR